MTARVLAVLLALVTVGFCLPAAFAGAAWLDSVEASRDFTQSAPLPAGGEIEIQSLGTGIRLVPGPAGAVTMTETVTVRTLTPDLARRALDTLPHGRLVADGQDLRVQLDQAPFRPFPALGSSQDLKLAIPVDAPVKISGGAGAVDAGGLRGDVDIELSAGAVRLTNIDVAHSVVVRAIAGAILFSGRLESNAVLDLESVNGAIDVTVPPGSDARYSASTVNGAVSVPGGEGGRGGTSASGVLGGTGSAVITLRTTNGAIHLATSGAA